MGNICGEQGRKDAQSGMECCMIKLAIVEDEREHAQLLKSYLQSWSEQSGQAVEIMMYAHGDAFLFDWEEQKDFTAVFLDIQMPKISGMELARRIRQDSEGLQIVFTTGISDYMQQGYEVSALHYLLKPLQEAQVCSCMERICKQAHKEEEWILLSSAEGVERIAADKIWWAEALGHGAAVGVEWISSEVRSDSAPKVRRLEVTDSLGMLKERLGSAFFQCHRSYLVNLSHVKRIEKADVVLDNDDRIPLSRRLYKQVNEAFIHFYQRGFEKR